MPKKADKAFAKKRLPLFILLFFLLFQSFQIQTNAAETTVLYKIQLKKLHPDVIVSLKSGAKITDAQSKSPIGKIESVAVMPHMAETYSASQDRMTLVPHPFFRDISLTVRALGTPQKNVYKIGAFNLFKGASLHFFTADFTGSGECAEIYESEELP